MARKYFLGLLLLTVVGLCSVESGGEYSEATYAEISQLSASEKPWYCRYLGLNCGTEGEGEGEGEDQITCTEKAPCFT